MAEEDIIFGKKRHYFGGIEPSDMVKFTARMDITNEHVAIEAELPNDTIVDGQMLCSVAGAIIRRRSDNYPVDEFDGVEVANITDSMTIFDSDVDVDGTYYYAAFPYTKQGVYNRSRTNMAVVNEPSAVTLFHAERQYQYTDYEPKTVVGVYINLKVTLSDDTAGAVIRRSTVRYPVDENDGDEITTVTTSGEYLDTKDIVANTTYYYTVFPYNSVGSYSRSTNNRAICTTYLCNYYFGYDLDTTNSDPETRVTYPEDVDNYGYAPAFMDYGTDTTSSGTSDNSFNYGGWDIYPGEKFMPRPCMLTYDGIVLDYLDPDDYTKTSTGVASYITDYSFEGNAMMEWPKIYTKREEVNGIYKFRCSDVKHDDTWDCWCNYDKNDNEIEHFYTSIYTTGGYGGKLRSMSGLYVPYYYKWNGQDSNTPSGSTAMSADNMITYAKANGDDWYTDVLADRLLIQDLLVMMARTTDGQTAYGKGIVSASSCHATAGSMNTRGMFFGDGSSTVGVKVFGMEHWWGNEERYLAGWVTAPDTNSGLTGQYIKITRGVRDGSTSTDYNANGTGYLCTIENVGINYAGWYYYPAMNTTRFGRIVNGWYDSTTPPNGSSSTYECDGTYTPSQGYIVCAYVGGNYSNSLQAGPFAARLNNKSSTVVANINTGLSCKPSATV